MRTRNWEMWESKYYYVLIWEDYSRYSFIFYVESMFVQNKNLSLIQVLKIDILEENLFKKDKTHRNHKGKIKIKNQNGKGQSK